MTLEEVVDLAEVEGREVRAVREEEPEDREELGPFDATDLA